MRKFFMILTLTVVAFTVSGVASPLDPPDCYPCAQVR